MSYTEHYYQSNDGLNLYYRKYGKNTARFPLVCLAGLTRNSEDFDEFAEYFSKDRAVYTLDYRGRGKSDYDPDYKNYNPQTYLGDIYAFLMAADIEKAIFVGTSLGGILSMAFASLSPQHVAAIILNDIGPEVSSGGGSRIAGYVGKDNRFKTIEAATDAQRQLYTGAYPDLDEAAWRKTTETGFVYDATAGNYRPNYDLALGKAFAEQMSDDPSVDLWPFFEALNSVPLLAIRGALSDVLSAETFQKMQEANPDMQVLTLENRGHVPLLNEPPAMKELIRFINNV